MKEYKAEIDKQAVWKACKKSKQQMADSAAYYMQSPPQMFSPHVAGPFLGRDVSL